MQWNNDPLDKQWTEDRDKIFLMTEIRNVHYILIREWLYKLWKTSINAILRNHKSYKELIILKVVKDTCYIYTVTTAKYLFLPSNSTPKKKIEWQTTKSWSSPSSWLLLSLMGFLSNSCSGSFLWAPITCYLVTSLTKPGSGFCKCSFLLHSNLCFLPFFLLLSRKIHALPSLYSYWESLPGARHSIK